MPGHIAAVQIGLNGIGDGGEDDGNVFILSGVEAGDGRGGGDAHHQIHVLGGKALGDLGVNGVVKAGVLVVHLKIGALRQTGLLQTLEKTDAAVVQGGVLPILVDADEIFFRGLGGGIGRCFLFFGAAGGQSQDQGQRQGGGSSFLHSFHDEISNLYFIKFSGWGW